MARYIVKPQTGIDGSKHSFSDIKRISGVEDLTPDTGSLWPAPKGVQYLGDNNWIVPKGATINSLGGNEYEIVLATGELINVWIAECGDWI